MTIGITVYAINTKNDFTVCGPLLYIFGFVFFTMSLFFFLFGNVMPILFATIGVILFSFYLLVDTQMIIGGKNRRFQVDEDSYILASVMLYLDIINIFLYLIQILN